MSFFNAATEARINQIHLDAFDTYKRAAPIRFYLEAQEVVVVDPDYNHEFDSLDGSNNEMIAEYRDFDACVIYLQRQEFADFIKGDDTNVRFKSVSNRIKIQVKEEAFEYLKAAERYVFGDEAYAIEMAWRKLGSLSTFIIYEITLQRVA